MAWIVPVQDELGDGVGGNHRRGDEQDDHEDAVSGEDYVSLGPDEHDQHDEDRDRRSAYPYACDGDTGTNRHVRGTFCVCHKTLQSIEEQTMSTIPYYIKKTI